MQPDLTYIAHYLALKIGNKLEWATSAFIASICVAITPNSSHSLDATSLMMGRLVRKIGS
jgi:hypothetical protein